MIRMRNLKPSGVTLAAVLAAFSALAAWRLSGALSSAGASPSPEGGESIDATVREKATPLDCRVVLLTSQQRRARMEKSEWLQRKFHEGLADTPRLYANPLIASYDWVKVEVENTSDQGFPIRDWDGQLFRVGYEVRDDAGKRVIGWYGDPTTRSLKRLVMVDPAPDGWVDEMYPLKIVAPGQVETYGLNLVGGPPTYCTIKPGRYAIYAVLTYFWGPELEQKQVQSRAFRVTVTEQDVREWKDLYK